VAARILFDRVPHETDPFSPDNLLIFSTGLLNARRRPAPKDRGQHLFAAPT
jgi:aldehyde:ferredoxin oxidoreductase